MSPLESLLNEAVWVWGFDELYTVTGDIDVAFSIVTTVSVLLMSVYVVKKTRNFVYLAFFLNPSFINLVAEQIRSGLASGLFFTAVWTRNIWIKAALLILPGLIHTSFILLSAFYVAFQVLKRVGPINFTIAKPFITLALITITAILLTLVRDVLLATIGDERAFDVLSYQSRVLLSLGYLSFSASYLLVSRDKSVTFESAFYLFNVVMALVSALVGFYGARFVAYGIPALAVMAAAIPAERRVLFFIQYAVFSIMYFFYWFV